MDLLFLFFYVFWVGDFLTVFSFFKYMFENFVSLLSISIPLGGNSSITIFGVLIGVIFLGIVVTVCRRLYD